MSIVPSRNKPIRPQEKQARLPGKKEKKLYTKLAQLPPGAKLHQWTFHGRWVPNGPASWRCVVCDYIDKAPWPHTPEPHEPYCPAGMGMID